MSYCLTHSWLVLASYRNPYLAFDKVIC